MNTEEWNYELGMLMDCLINSEGEYVDQFSELIMVLARKRMGVACPDCQGKGIRLYDSTATWKGGMGCSAMTTDVCDTCWGTGRTDKTGVDLRKIREEMDQLRNEASCKYFDHAVGGNIDIAKRHFPAIVKKLRKARWTGFWEARVAETVASVLERLSK